MKLIKKILSLKLLKMNNLIIVLKNITALTSYWIYIEILYKIYNKVKFSNFE